MQIIPFYDFLPSLQRNSDLASTTVSYFVLFSVTTTLHNMHKAFTLTYPSTDKSEYNTYLRNRVIIEIFQKRSDVMQMSTYN